jgi:hypothetical protein
MNKSQSVAVTRKNPEPVSHRTAVILLIAFHRILAECKWQWVVHRDAQFHTKAVEYFTDNT